MKEKIFNSIKKMKSNALNRNQIILTFMFLVVILLSLQNDGLFIKELALIGAIMFLATISSKSKNQDNSNW
ncbi:hypothetical protein [Hyunsoonleella rubra]|uniref:Uncharacterized protein n=1 Tax=Hyunsoonleella rubra TaxID=1737062 RepID=A0ABW5TDE5_9FLAO